jgi:hypothetical protein
MTWNAEGISSNGRELALLSLLNDNNIDVGIITETEIPTSSHGDFNVEGYHTFLPDRSDKLKTAKYCMMVVVRSELAAITKIHVTSDLEATVAVLNASMTDHFPVVAAVKISKVTPASKTLKRRNFKGLERPAFMQALDAWLWADVYWIRDPDKVLDFITRGIVNGLSQAAPLKSITVREGSLPVYLRPNTLALMAKNDFLGRCPWYRAVRNWVTAMIRRDREASNLSKLVELGKSPAVLWEIANAAVGKPRQPLPASLTRAEGMQTEGNIETANTINGYYVQKVLRIRAGRGVQNTSQMTSTTSRDGDRRGKNTFAFGFSSAGQIAKIFPG